MRVMDGDWELVLHDVATGRSVWRMFDGRLTHYRTDYPVSHVLDANAAARSVCDADGADGRGPDGIGRRVASVPLNLFYDQLHEAQAQEDHRYINRWLNDSDNAGFRTNDARV